MSSIILISMSRKWSPFLFFGVVWTGPVQLPGPQRGFQTYLKMNQVVWVGEMGPWNPHLPPFWSGRVCPWERFQNVFANKRGGMARGHGALPPLRNIFELLVVLTNCESPHLFWSIHRGLQTCNAPHAVADHKHRLSDDVFGEVPNLHPFIYFVFYQKKKLE